MAQPKFRDSEVAQRSLERVAALSSERVAEIIRTALSESPDPDRALTNIERWLVSTGSPQLYADQLVASPEMCAQVLGLLGVSQPIADVLIQNPELSSLLFEPNQLGRIPERTELYLEGSRLLAASSSYAHALDRLRFLRQRWMLTITLNDFAERWTQETVWRALSDLADALISLAFSCAWSEFRKLRSLPEACPVMVVSFGKLGGHELNYSSDVDLTYVIQDDVEERIERDCGRFCEAFGRALSDRMGRGALYRVDLRLRPYGAAGPILKSMRGVEGYYGRYSEPWEVQALLRSRPIVGPLDLIERWETLRVATCFKRHVSEVALEEIFSARTRMEESAMDDDIKRASGGIRDVEFLVQALQLLHGATHPNLQVRTTLGALRNLEADGFLDHAVASALSEGYTFLRKLEHRIQLVGDQQTHELPSSPVAREALANTMGRSRWSSLENDLKGHRRTIHTLYRSTLNLDPDALDARSQIARDLGVLGPAALQWFDVLAESDAFYAQLRENEGSLQRVRRILECAPKLVARFKASVPLTELLLSGEIEEEEAASAISWPARGSGRLDWATLAQQYSNGVTKVAARSVLRTPTALGIAESESTVSEFQEPETVLPYSPGPESEFTHLAEKLLISCLEHVAPSLTVIGLGSFGNRECSFASDLDLILMVDDDHPHLEGERQGQALLTAISQLRQNGSGIDVDLRLRPEGRKGLLVRTLSGFKAYADSDIELWERFALGHARLIRGAPEVHSAVMDAAYGLPISSVRMEELLEMKLRVETERVLPQHLWRQIKLGHGGLNDLEWLVHLHEMRYPSATGADGGGPFDERIRRLVGAQLLNALESDFLLAARSHLLEVRLRLQMLGFEGDLVPENPDKLDRLAVASGDSDGNAFLARHTPIVEGVRRLYHESLERLIK